MNRELSPQNTPVRHLTARQVLSLHADLQRSFSPIPPKLKNIMIRYAKLDVSGHPEWRASHLSPAINDDLEPWLRSLGTDLAKARTYQATAEMVELAQNLTKANPLSAAEFLEEELPSPAGFLWLDKPVPRPSDDDYGKPPIMLHAISWVRVAEMPLWIATSDDQPGFSITRPAIRIREWGYEDNPAAYPRPLHLMGQTTVAISDQSTGFRISNRLPSQILLHMLWILMDTEVIACARQKPDKYALQKAANLKSRDVTVITLARAKHPKKSDDEEQKHVDWSCTWIVRGHKRKAPNGTFRDGRTETWVKPYLKGPDGMPLRASDALYRLSQADY